MTTTATDWTAAPVTDLMDHIVATHHEFLRAEMPRITRLLADAPAAAGAIVRELQAVWAPFVEEMNAHLWKEEQVLFPMARSMAAGATGASSHCGGVHNPVRMMMMEHDAADQALRAFHRITGGYRVTGDTAAGLATLYRALQDLEADLRIHMYKENDVLFPRLVAME